MVSVGAGIGTEAFISARLVGPSGKVLAIGGSDCFFATRNGNSSEQL